MDNILSEDSSLSGNSSQTRKRILVFGTMGEIGPIVRDDLTRLGHYVQLVDFPQNTFRDEPGYRRTLLKAVEDFGPDIILPVGHQLAMARIKEARDKEARIKETGIQGTATASGEEARIKETGIPGAATASDGGISPLLAGCWIPVPSSEHILLLDSKLQASRIATELGISQPEILFINDPSAQTCGNELSLPDFEHGEYIFKRDKSFGGTGVLRPKNREGLLKLIENERTRSFLVQKFIEGTDLSVDCVRFSFPTANEHNNSCEAADEHNCSCKAANGHENSCGTETFFRAECYVTVERKNGQGPAVERKRAECPIAVEYARSILDHIDYQGVCGIDFRIPYGAADNFGPAAGTGASPLFLECNPRFTGGIGLQIAEGFDIPQILASRLVNE